MGVPGCQYAPQVLEFVRLYDQADQFFAYPFTPVVFIDNDITQ